MSGKNWILPAAFLCAQLSLPSLSSGQTWTEKAAGVVTKPSGRYAPAMAFDSNRNVVVLFGGKDGSGESDETWEWDGSTWTQKASGAVTKPSARRGPAMAFDSSRNVAVLFGGHDGSSCSDETWEWNGSTWSQKASGAVTKPSARYYQAMAFDSNRNVIVLFGGTDGSRSDETWEWDGSTWTQKATGAVAKPAARLLPAMAFCSSSNVVVLFGGWENLGNSDETWEWDGSTWTERASGAITKPPGRRQHAMAFDGRRNTVVLFGGFDGSNLLDDTWAWDGNIWVRRYPVTWPSARNSFAMAFDDNRGAVVLFGGYDGSNSDETWEYYGPVTLVADGSDYTTSSGTSERTVWRPANGKWYVEGQTAVKHGQNGDIPTPGDYDNDGQTDKCVWRPANGRWYLLGSGSTRHGQSGDIPVPGDYSGTTATDMVVWRPSNGRWYDYTSGTNTKLGQNGDIPVPGDWDGDNKDEYAVWRPSNGRWYFQDGTNTKFGRCGDIPVPADYNGDGQTDAAVWRPCNGRWYLQFDGSKAKLGQSSDTPVPGDFNGDGSFERVVWRTTNGRWYHYGGASSKHGQTGDVPLVRGK